MKSGWWLEEFKIAHRCTVEGRRKLLVPVKLEDIPDEEIDKDLKVYMKTFTYADVKSLELFRKKLLFAMPKYPLRYCQYHSFTDVVALLRSVATPDVIEVMTSEPGKVIHADVMFQTFHGPINLTFTCLLVWGCRRG